MNATEKIKIKGVYLGVRGYYQDERVVVFHVRNPVGTLDEKARWRRAYGDGKMVMFCLERQASRKSVTLQVTDEDNFRLDFVAC